MAKVTPAHIEYEDANGNLQVLDFHAIISEEHEASATLTKYPVMVGYHVTNQSIQHNRMVSIEAIVSNTRPNALATDFQTEADNDYGSPSPQSVVFDVLTGLVNGGIYCTVTTNLTIYKRVLFKKFKTKQAAGSVDSIRFTLLGEESISVTEDNYVSPAPVVWTRVSDANRPVVQATLAENGFITGDCDELWESSYIDGESFVLTDLDANGNTATTTYVYAGKDPATGASNYEIHYDYGQCAVVNPGEEVTVTRKPCEEESFEDSIIAGVNQVSCCLLAEAEDIVLDFVEDTIDTAMGKLKASIYGVYSEIVGLAGGKQSVGGALTAAGIGCVVRGITGNDDTYDYQPGEALPSTSQIMDGASQGLGFTNPPPAKFSLIQIQCNCRTSEEESVEMELLPTNKAL